MVFERHARTRHRQRINRLYHARERGSWVGPLRTAEFEGIRRDASDDFAEAADPDQTSAPPPGRRISANKDRFRESY